MALTEKLTAIAEAIRGKTGKTDGLTLDQMPGEIAGIQSGGGGDYAFVCDAYEVHTKIVNVGANTVTNIVQALDYLSALIDGGLNTVVLISPYGTVNNQFIMRKNGEEHTKFVRFRDGALVEASCAAAYDAILVEGTQYLLTSLVYPE